MKRTFAGIGLTVLFSAAAVSQSSGKPPAFEVADVHVSSGPNASLMVNSVLMQGPFIAGGLYRVRTATMLDLIVLAYGVDANKVVGGPAWLEEDRYEVNAKVPAHSTAAAMKIMLQNLLEERFQLAVHNDSSLLPAYALKIGKKPLLKQADGSGESGCKTQPQTGPNRASNGMLTFSCRNISMQTFADGMLAIAARYLNGYPVVDQTELKGSWDFDFTFRIAGATVPAGEERVTLFDGVQKLGLELSLTKAPMPVLIVDRVNQKPAANPPGVTQSLPALPTAFDVAEIKPTAPDNRISRLQIQPGGRVNIEGITLKVLIEDAWDIRINDEMLAGPKFLDTERFDIIAQAPTLGQFEPSGQGVSSKGVDYTLIYPMLRTLLIERFKMAVHYEDRPVTAFNLTAVKPKLQKADPSSRTSCHNGPAAGEKDPRPPNLLNSVLVTCQNMTMTQLAGHLVGPVYVHNATVLDDTGLEGGWDFTLNYIYPSSSGAASSAPGEPSGATIAASTPDGGLTLFEALEKQLGLKLEMTKRTGSVLVIDHVEQRPTEN